MMNTRISYSHIILSLVLLLAAVAIAIALTAVEPSAATTAYASDGIIGVDAANVQTK